MTERNSPPTGPRRPGGPAGPGRPEHPDGPDLPAGPDLATGPEHPTSPGQPTGRDLPAGPGEPPLWARKPKARHRRNVQATTLTPAVEALLRRTRLVGAGIGTPRESFRVAGVPVLIAAVVAGGPGWTTYVVRDG